MRSNIVDTRAYIIYRTAEMSHDACLSAAPVKVRYLLAGTRPGVQFRGAAHAITTGTARTGVNLVRAHDLSPQGKAITKPQSSLVYSSGQGKVQQLLDVQHTLALLHLQYRLLHRRQRRAGVAGRGGQG